MKRTCPSCGELFVPRSTHQRYCSKPECQRYRKSQWQKKKLADDTAYRANQADAQKLWRRKNPHYMRDYRAAHPEYVSRNRCLQKQRRLRYCGPSLSRPDSVVKMDARGSQIPVLSGRYRLVPTGVVKMDAITVQLSVL